MNPSLGKIIIFDKEGDGKKLPVLCFINSESALSCYKNEMFSYNEVTRLIFDTKEAYHRNIEKDKFVLILDTIQKSYISIYKIFCDDSIFWVHGYNIEIIK
jgi:hypothetical protein